MTQESDEELGKDPEDQPKAPDDVKVPAQGEAPQEPEEDA